MGERNNKPKQVVWKDTNKYPFALQYAYPLSIRNRCLFFWAATSKGWKAVLNLADRLTESNRICIVYLYGTAKEDSILRYVEKLNNQNIIVFWANYISVVDIESVNKAIEAINVAKKFGIRSEENLVINEVFSFDWENAIRAAIPRAEYAEAIKKGKQVNDSIIQQIMERGFVIASRNKAVPAEENAHIQHILKEMVNIYPSSVESDTNIDYAYKMLHFEKWCKVGLYGDYKSLDKLGVGYEDETAEYVQLSLFDNTSFGIKDFVQKFQCICDYGIEKNGFIDLKMVFQQMQKPPFGLYKCNYYGLCIGIALRKYSKKYYKSSNLNSCYTENIDFSLEAKYIIDSFGLRRPASLYIYMQSPEQIELAEKIARLFPDVLEISCMCLENVLTNAISWICDNILYDTVQRTIPQLFEIINLREPCVCSNITEKYAEWLTDERVEEIREQLKHVDENFLRILEEKYGEEKTKLYAKSHIVKGSAIGWLHTVEMVDEGVEKYMKETICRECGAVIHDYNEVYENGVQGKHARMSKKDIIGLNQKMLGRYQIEFFCIRCLCEELDCTEWQLYEKKESFKEQGCELFG